MPALSKTPVSGILSCHLMWRTLRRQLEMSVVLGVSAVDSPGLADVEERGQSVEPQLSGEVDASPLQ